MQQAGERVAGAEHDGVEELVQLLTVCGISPVGVGAFSFGRGGDDEERVGT